MNNRFFKRMKFAVWGMCVVMMVLGMEVQAQSFENDEKNVLVMQFLIPSPTLRKVPFSLGNRLRVSRLANFFRNGTDGSGNSSCRS